MKLTATYKGLITGAAMILLSVVLFYGMKLPHDDPSQVFVIAIYAAGIIWSLVSLHRSAAGNLNFKSYFSEGFKTFIVATLLIVLFKGIFFKLNPQIMEAAIKETELLVAKAGDKTPAEIAENSEKLRSIFMPMTSSLTMVTFLFFGALTTVVTGLILKVTGSNNRRINEKNN